LVDPCDQGTNPNEGLQELQINRPWLHRRFFRGCIGFDRCSSFPKIRERNPIRSRAG
jgi:hypothetical protein